MKDFKIDPDSPFGKELGFTTNKFSGWLWRKGNVIYVSFIVSLSESRGNLRNLLKNIHEKGFTIKIPTPFPRMEKICERLGFKHKTEKNEMFGVIEIMELEGKK